MIETLIKNLIAEPRRSGIIKFHKTYLNRFNVAYGSRSNHQAWEGGYRDHITQCFEIANSMYRLSSWPMFDKSSALSVLYFHDIEKMFKYVEPVIDTSPDEWYDKFLPHDFDIHFNKQERNALKYVHGEGNDYSPDKRVMCELAAFCHAIDVMSARIFYSRITAFGAK